MSEGSSDSIAAWPITLPLPYVDYTGNPFHVTEVSPADTPKIARRNRYINALINISVRWVFNTDEYEDFKVFFQEDIDTGMSKFRIELRYPLNSALVPWRVRFMSDGYKATYQEGMWEVEASLDLLYQLPTVIPPALEALGYGQFFVDPVESTGEDSPLITADGYPLYCKT